MRCGRLTGYPAQNLSLSDRGLLKAGYYADIVVFDPDTIADRATYDKPHQLAVGVEDVLVNGQFAFKDGKATGASTGRVVHGRAWQGAPAAAAAPLHRIGRGASEFALRADRSVIGQNSQTKLSWPADAGHPGDVFHTLKKIERLECKQPNWVARIRGP